MNTIGIIGAMDEEVVLLKEKMDVIAAKNIIDTDFYIGKMSGNSVIVVRSGIGKVNAAICTQVLIDLYGVDYIINTGVAGALAKELDISDVVISEDLVQHDFDASAAGDPIGVISRMKDSFFKADANLIAIAKEASNTVLVQNKALIGRIASGDQFISSGESKRRIRDNFKALCVEMEGAAIAHAAYLNKIPFVVIRAISDKADEQADISFDKFVKVAAKKSSDIVELMVQNI